MNHKINLIFLLILSIYCVKAPDKPDPPYVVLQYLQNVNSSQNQNNQNNGSQCPTATGLFNPSAVADTGQTLCYNGVGTAVPCAGTGYDGEYNNIPNARNFVGPTQHCVYPSDYTTLDTLHGLTWKTCAQGLSGANCSGGAVTTITWNDANAGLPGSCSELNTLNGGKGYAGKTDWRIPTIHEMASLFHYANNPHIDTSFPNTFTGTNYWSNTPYLPVPNNHYVVNFNAVNLGFFLNDKILSLINLRCVSGNQRPAQVFVDNGDETITDSNTGLLWMKCTQGLSGPTCTNPTPASFDNLDWNAAGFACENLNFAGRTNWRLPNANELLSIVDSTQAAAPFIKPIFPNTDNNMYWSSTTYDANKGFAMFVDFMFGVISPSDKASLVRARCVTTN